MSGVEKAAWWTEYVIRHKNDHEYFVNNSLKDFGFFQYYLIDVFAFLFLVILIVLGVVYILLKYIVQKIRKLISPHNVGLKKNN